MYYLRHHYILWQEINDRVRGLVTTCVDKKNVTFDLAYKILSGLYIGHRKV